MSQGTAEALAGLTGGITPGTDGPSSAPFKTNTDAAKEIHSKSPQYVTVPGEYTMTHSTKSDSGMYFHFHDKKGQTFHSVVHPTGTFQEMQSDGSIAEGVTGNKKTSVDGNYTVGSQGNMAIFSNSDMEFRVKGKLKITADSIEIVAAGGIKSTAGATHTIIGAKVDINP